MIQALHLLTVVLVGLKLTGVIALGWLTVLAPSFAAVSIGLAAALAAVFACVLMS